VDEKAEMGGLARGTVVALLAMSLAVFVVAIDFTALSVALPSIEARFDSDVSTVQWVINAYALVFGVSIVTGGRLADLFGRKRLFLIGAAIFAVFSLLGSASPEIGWLIGARGLTGIGGAIMWPATLGMTYSLLPAERAGLAGGLIIGSAGLGNAAGPLLGGMLTDWLSWRWVLLVNVPIAAVAALAVWRTVPESRGETEERHVDYLGIATLSLGLVSLLLALDVGSETDWGSLPVVCLFLASPLLLVPFVLVERRGGEGALLPPDALRSRPFRIVCLSVLLVSPTFFAALMFLPQYLQKIQGYSALGAGACLLPLMLVFAAVSFWAGTLYNRLGAKPIISAGALLICAGLFLSSLVTTDSTYVALVPGLVVMGIGVGLYYSSVTTAGVTALDPSRPAWQARSCTWCRSRVGRSGSASRPRSSPESPTPTCGRPPRITASWPTGRTSTPCTAFWPARIRHSRCSPRFRATSPQSSSPSRTTRSWRVCSGHSAWTPRSRSAGSWSRSSSSAGRCAGSAPVSVGRPGRGRRTTQGMSGREGREPQR
jgi:EmrB/QacA subfamily drug resistance transporter